MLPGVTICYGAVVEYRACVVENIDGFSIVGGRLEKSEKGKKIFFVVWLVRIVLIQKIILVMINIKKQDLIM